MDNRVDEALGALKKLGSPDEIRELASQGYGPKKPLRFNSHIHLPPNFSAFETVTQAIELASQQAIGLLGVSNYYDYQVYADFVEQAGEKKIFPVFGLEIISMKADLLDSGIKVNDPGNPGKTYVCGKGITRFGEMTTKAQELLDRIRKNDQSRMREMISRVSTIFNERGLPNDVNENTVIEMVVNRHQSPRETVYLQERHISQAFQEMLFEKVSAENRIDVLNKILDAGTKASNPGDFVAIQNDIRSHLMKAGKPAFVEEAFLSFEEARELILELGGIPCYPTLADGTSPFCAFEQDVDELINKLLEAGVYAAEWILPRNSIEVARSYANKMRDAGFVLTAGTEHNTLDLIPIAPTCEDGEVPEDLLQLFWEGACVVVAHQFLTLHGECGYVDSKGELNPEFSSKDERITELAKFGAAVIGQFQENYSPV